MKTQEVIYINFTPLELWRLGIESSPRLDKVRVPPRPPKAKIDIHTYTKNGQIWVKAETGGVSLFDGKNPRISGTHWWRIPSNSPIPAELRIRKTHTDRITGLTHYLIEPIADMPLDLFIYLLTVFAKHAEKSFSTADRHEKTKS